MKTFGWSGALLCAILSTTFVWNGGLASPAANATAVATRLSAGADELNSEAGMRFRFSQARHWRNLVLGR